MDKKSTYYIIAIICAVLILLLSQITLLSKGFYSISADESFHTFQAYAWSKHQFHENFVWLPFFKIFVGSFFYFFNNLLIIPRIISMCFGILTLFAITYLSHLLFHDQIINILTALLASVFTPLLVLSVLPLSGIMFYFFIIMALAFFVKWLNEKKAISLIISCMFFAASNMVRYEGWVYSFCFFLMLVIIFYREDSIKNKYSILLLSGLLLSFFPIFWISIDYADSGKLLGFVGIVSHAYKPGSFIQNLNYNPLFQFVKLNLFSFNILGLIPFIILSHRDKRIRNFFYVFMFSLVLLSLFGFWGKTMPSHNYWRIAGSWSLLILPFTAYLLNLVFKTDFSIKYFNTISFILITFLFIFFFNRQNIHYSSTSYFTKSDYNTGKYMEKLMNQSDDSSNSAKRILIISNDYHFINVEISSQKPFLYRNVVKPLKKNRYIKVKNDITFNLASLRNDSIKYIIFPSHFLKYYKVINLNLKKIITIGYWSIFCIT